jgi:hypothetical protein
MFRKKEMTKLSDTVITRTPSTFKIVLTNELYKENFGNGLEIDLVESQKKYFENVEGKQFNSIKSWPTEYKNISNMNISSIMWVKQKKEDKVTDRYIIKATRNGEYIYAVSDVFYIDSIYIIKFLGLYSELGKLASVNFKHQGNVEAQTNTSLAEVPLYTIPESTSFLKRANPFYFWLELFGA